MEAVLDSGGRLLVPKSMREALGLEPGSVVDISFYGAGIQILPGGPVARVVREGGHLVLDSDAVVTDEMVFSLIDAGRR